MTQLNISLFKKIDKISTAYVCKCGHGFIIKSFYDKNFGFCNNCQNETFGKEFIYKEEKEIEDERNYLKATQIIYSYEIDTRTLKIINKKSIKTLYLSKFNGKVYFANHHKNFEKVPFESRQDGEKPLIILLEKYLNESIWNFAASFMFKNLDSLTRKIISIKSLPSDINDVEIGSTHEFIDYLSYKHKGKKELKKYFYKRFENRNIFHKINFTIEATLCSLFKDYNYLMKILKSKNFLEIFADIYLGYEYCIFYNATELKMYFRFLLRNYSEKEISKLFCKEFSCEKKDLVIDSIRMITKLQYNKYLLRKKIKKNTNILENIHNYLIQCYNKVFRKNRFFEYTIKQRELEISFDNFKFVLAKDSNQLIHWGKKLHHCVGSYMDIILNKKCLVIGVYEKSEIKYCIDIDLSTDYYNIESIKKIRQCKGKYNSEPILEDKERILKWYEINNFQEKEKFN